jgi:hypothetical protein
LCTWNPTNHQAEKKKEMHAAKERQERLYAPLPFIRMKKLKTKSQSNGALATLNAGTPAFDLSPGEFTDPSVSIGVAPVLPVTVVCQ